MTFVSVDSYISYIHKYDTPVSRNVFLRTEPHFSSVGSFSTCVFLLALLRSKVLTTVNIENFFHKA